MVDIKCSFPYENLKKRECCTSSSDAPNEDESLLRPPMRTSFSGFKEAKTAYENGTDEVRRLLMQECSLIYECNICLNMFRSFANFISHKRKYCKRATADNFHSFSDCSSNVRIQNVIRSEPLVVKSRSTGSSPIPNTKPLHRDLSKVIERLKRVEVSSHCSHNKPLLVECKMNAYSPEPKAPDPVLELEHVSTTKHAVFQTLKTKNYTDSIKTELDEVHNLLTNQKMLLGPDGKAINDPALVSFTSSKVNDGEGLVENNCKATQFLPGIYCQICKMTFQTEKTLKLHVQKNHTSTTYVFQCPTCSMTFLQPSAVLRHLANEHKKPLRRIRKMRDTILKKRIQIGDVEVKGLGRELKKLQMTNTKDLDSFSQENGRSITSCTYCLKNFERRAALATHLANCLVRKTSFNNAELLKKISVPNEQNNKAKNSNQLSNYLLEHNESDQIINGEKSVVKLNIKQEPQEELNSATNSSNINKLFENLENQTFGSGLHTVCLEKVEMMVELKEKSAAEQEKIKDVESKGYDLCDDQSNEQIINEIGMVSGRNAAKKEKNKCFRVVSASKQLTCRCKICNKQFNVLSNLRRHISMFHYRSRRFGCSLCDYRAFRRYDIVNHLTFVHKMTGERESMAVEYVTVHELKHSKDDVDGDIVVLNDDAIVSEQHEIEEQQLAKESQTLSAETTIKTCEKKKSKNVVLQLKKDTMQPLKTGSIASKVVRRKFKKSLEQVEGKKRPIRNRVKTVNKDFVYDLITMKKDQKLPSRLALKRRNSVCEDQNVEFAQPPIKISPYRLRTEPLMPTDKSCVKGTAANVSRNVIHEGLAAPSTLPELPTQRPQMRPRLISSSRSDSHTVPIIETSELEAAGLKSTFFDDSFLEKFAKKSNPSFKMKPLLALTHSPLNSILKKFDASQQNNINRVENNIFPKPPEQEFSSPPNYTICLLQSLTQPILEEKDVTPNGKQILDQSSPPATPKKRITLMQRLVENRTKRRDSLIRTALEN